MSVLIETTLGDLVIDLDVDGSPHLCQNFLKLVKARYYSGTLFYNVQENRYCQTGDPKGDGTGGCSIFGLIDYYTNSNNLKSVEQSQKRFLKAAAAAVGGGEGEGGGQEEKKKKKARELTKEEKRQKGILSVVEIGGVLDTIGSQFLITLGSGDQMSLDGISGDQQRFLSLGVIAEDDENVLDKINQLYCDEDGRPYTDVRIKKALILHDPFPDPEGLNIVLEKQGVVFAADDDSSKDNRREYDCAISSPNILKPSEEIVPHRISVTDVLNESTNEMDITTQNEMREKKEAQSNEIMLEMLGDLPSAAAAAASSSTSESINIKPPDNVLFVCKLNPVTQDDDLELIFSRFDPTGEVQAEIIRDPMTGQSLNYAFVEFSTNEACAQAYLKMNHALIDDRRIHVDFSQSVSKEWNKYTQQLRRKKDPKNNNNYSRQNQHQNHHVNNNRQSYNNNNNKRQQQQQYHHHQGRQRQQSSARNQSYRHSRQHHDQSHNKSDDNLNYNRHHNYNRDSYHEHDRRRRTTSRRNSRSRSRSRSRSHGVDRHHHRNHHNSNSNNNNNRERRRYNSPSPSPSPASSFHSYSSFSSPESSSSSNKNKSKSHDQRDSERNRRKKSSRKRSRSTSADHNKDHKKRKKKKHHKHHHHHKSSKRDSDDHHSSSRGRGRSRDRQYYDDDRNIRDRDGRRNDRSRSRSRERDRRSSSSRKRHSSSNNNKKHRHNTEDVDRNNR